MALKISSTGEPSSERSFNKSTGLAPSRFQRYRPFPLPERLVSSKAPTPGSYQNTPLKLAERISGAAVSPPRRSTTLPPRSVKIHRITSPLGATKSEGNAPGDD